MGCSACCAAAGEHKKGEVREVRLSRVVHGQVGLGGRSDEARNRIS